MVYILNVLCFIYTKSVIKSRNLNQLRIIYSSGSSVRGRSCKVITTHKNCCLGKNISQLEVLQIKQWWLKGMSVRDKAVDASLFFFR